MLMPKPWRGPRVSTRMLLLAFGFGLMTGLGYAFGGERLREPARLWSAVLLVVAFAVVGLVMRRFEPYE